MSAWRRRVRRGTGLRLTARFRWAAVLLLLPLLGLAAVSGAGLVVSANASAALDHAQQLNGLLASLDEDVQHFGLTALDVLIGHQADDLAAMTASEQQVDADFAALARATGFTAAQEQALPLVAGAWSATIANRDAIRSLENSIQTNAAAASRLEDAIDVDERSLTSRVAAVENLGAAHVAGLRQERDGAVLASALAVGIALVIGIAIAIWLSRKLAQSVLRQACAQGRAWADAGLPKLRIAVNLSGSNLNNPDLVATVAATLADSGFPAANLELELTEGVVIAESDGALATLHGLKALGLSLAIDDFGTGYSALSRLRALPFDTLKVDKIFVDELDAVQPGSTLAESILDMARLLGLKVVAEGVETSRQADFLRRHGCDFGQGYLFSRPLGVAAFETLLLKESATRSVIVEPAVA